MTTAESLIKTHYSAARAHVKAGDAKAAREEILAFIGIAYHYGYKRASNRISEWRAKEFILKWHEIAVILRTEGITEKVKTAFAPNGANRNMPTPVIPTPISFVDPQPTRSVPAESGAVDYEQIIRDIVRDVLPDEFGNMNSRMFENMSDCVVEIRTGRGKGTGFIISREGYLITNEHVAHPKDNIGRYLFFFNSKIGFPIEVVEYDKRADIALCRFDPKTVNREIGTVEFEPDYARHVKVGSRIAMIGCSLGEKLNILDGVVRDPGNSEGDLVYALDSNPGDSGGPILSLNGKCIGVNKMRLLEQDGNHVDGFAFATPTPIVLTLLEKWGKRNLINYGK